MRGFNLANTGAYRVDGAYFVRDYTLPDTVLSGVSVMSAVNSARLAYPSPSGVVDYRLRASKAGDHSVTATLGVRELGQTVVETAFSFADKAGQFGIAGGTFWTTPVEYPNEVRYRVNNIGLVPQWRPNDTVRVRGVFSAEYSDYRGELGYLSSARALPPKLTYHNYGPPWTTVKRLTINSGVLVDAMLNDAWSLSATTFYADNRRYPADFTLLTLRPDRKADITFNRTTDQHSRALSSEGVLAYRAQTGSVAHTLSAAVRNRLSRGATDANAPVPLGVFDLTNGVPSFGPEPTYLGAASTTRSNVNQMTGSIGYTGLVGEFLEFRAGVHRSRYDKRFASGSGGLSQRLESRWLYNASVVWAVDRETTLFADVVKGIEESGVAPQNALNREEVLPPVVAEEYEFGVRHSLTDKLALSAAVFDVKKLTPGLRSDGIYALIGDVHHRGAELSIAGEIVTGTTVVAGALAMKPRLQRPGLPKMQPVGVSSNVVVASINHQLNWLGLHGWSADARATLQSPRVADAAASFKTASTASVSLGTRFDFVLADLPAQLRIVAVNVGTSRPWSVGPSGLLTQGDPFRIRASLRLKLR